MDTPLETPPGTAAEAKAIEANAVEAKGVDRRARSRTPLKIILIVLFITTALWIFDLYTTPSWDKIVSFLQGYFFGSFVMAWILQRADRMTA
jgi:hypothetical protein